MISWIEWPDKAARDAGMMAIVADERMKQVPEMPFDAKRMIFNGFTPVVALAKDIAVSLPRSAK